MKKKLFLLSHLDVDIELSLHVETSAFVLKAEKISGFLIQIPSLWETKYHLWCNAKASGARIQKASGLSCRRSAARHVQGYSAYWTQNSYVETKPTLVNVLQFSRHIIYRQESMQTPSKLLPLPKREIWLALSSSFIAAWVFSFLLFYDFRKLLAFSGRTCIFFWHLKKQTNKTPSWSLFELRQSYWIKYMPRNTTSLICIEKVLTFHVTLLLLYTVAGAWYRCHYPNFTKKNNWHEVAAVWVVAPSRSRSGRMTWLYIFQTHRELFGSLAGPQRRSFFLEVLTYVIKNILYSTIKTRRLFHWAFLLGWH